MTKVPITFNNKAETTQQSPEIKILSEMEIAPRYTLFALFALLYADECHHQFNHISATQVILMTLNDLSIVHVPPQ